MPCTRTCPYGLAEHFLHLCPLGPLPLECQVHTLRQAMDRSYDIFYASLPSFSFRACDRKYDPINEVADPRIMARAMGRV